MVYIYRVDWVKQAEIVFIFKFSNSEFLEFFSTFISKANNRLKKSKTIEETDDNKPVEGLEVNEAPRKVKNLKGKILKKVVLFSAVMAIFIISLFTRNLNPVNYNPDEYLDYQNSTLTNSTLNN